MTRILTLPEVLEATRISRSALYRMIESNEFPRPLKLGERRNGWTDQQIEGWIADRLAATQPERKA